MCQVWSVRHLRIVVLKYLCWYVLSYSITDITITDITGSYCILTSSIYSNYERNKYAFNHSSLIFSHSASLLCDSVQNGLNEQKELVAVALLAAETTDQPRAELAKQNEVMKNELETLAEAAFTQEGLPHDPWKRMHIQESRRINVILGCVRLLWVVSVFSLSPFSPPSSFS